MSLGRRLTHGSQTFLPCTAPQLAGYLKLCADMKSNMRRAFAAFSEDFCHKASTGALAWMAAGQLCATGEPWLAGLASARCVMVQHPLMVAPMLLCR